MIKSPGRKAPGRAIKNTVHHSEEESEENPNWPPTPPKKQSVAIHRKSVLKKTKHDDDLPHPPPPPPTAHKNPEPSFQQSSEFSVPPETAADPLQRRKRYGSRWKQQRLQALRVRLNIIHLLVILFIMGLVCVGVGFYCYRVSGDMECNLARGEMNKTTSNSSDDEPGTTPDTNLNTLLHNKSNRFNSNMKPILHLAFFSVAGVCFGIVPVLLLVHVGFRIIYNRRMRRKNQRKSTAGSESSTDSNPEETEESMMSIDASSSSPQVRGEKKA